MPSKPEMTIEEARQKALNSAKQAGQTANAGASRTNTTGTAGKTNKPSKDKVVSVGL